MRQDWWNQESSTTPAVPRGGALPAPGSAGPGSYAPPPGYIYNPSTGQYERAPGSTVAPGYEVDPNNPLAVRSTNPNGGPLNPGQSAVMPGAVPPPTSTLTPPRGPAAAPPHGSIGEIALSPSPNYPTPAPMPSVPTFTPPTYAKPPAFKGPSVEEALNDPSYQFRKQQGEQSLERWAAARGTLNDSGTAKALLDYGQGAASQEYQQEWNRAYGTYQTNYQTQYTDPNNIAFRDAAASFAPQMVGYSTTAQATQRNNELQQQYAYNTWLEDWNKYFGMAQLQAQ